MHTQWGGLIFNEKTNKLFASVGIASYSFRMLEVKKNPNVCLVSSIIMIPSHTVQVWPVQGRGAVLRPLRHHWLHRKPPVVHGRISSGGGPREAPPPAVAVEAQGRPGQAFWDPEKKLGGGEDVQRQRHHHRWYCWSSACRRGATPYLSPASPPTLHEDCLTWKAAGRSCVF